MSIKELGFCGTHGLNEELGRHYTEVQKVSQQVHYVLQDVQLMIDGSSLKVTRESDMGGTETNPLYGEDSFLVNIKFSAGNPLELLLGKQVSFVPGESRVTSME